MDGGVRLCLALSGVAAAVLAFVASPVAAHADHPAGHQSPAHTTSRATGQSSVVVHSGGGAAQAPKRDHDAASSQSHPKGGGGHARSAAAAQILRSRRGGSPAATSHARRHSGTGSGQPAGTTPSHAVLAAATPASGTTPGRPRAPVAPVGSSGAARPAGGPAPPPPVIAAPPTTPKPLPIAVPQVPAGARMTWILGVVVAALAIAVMAAVRLAARWGRSRR